MKVLFVSSIGSQQTVQDGYTIATRSMLTMFDYLTRCGELDELDTYQVQSKSVLPTKRYDVAVIMLNPQVLCTYHKLLTEVKQACNTSDRVFLSIVWETVPLPVAWDVLFNDDVFTGFIGPSLFVCNQLRQKTDKTVYYVPYLIENKNPVVRTHQQREFTALFIGQFTIRKGFEEAVIAFIRELGYEQDVHLILKGHHVSQRDGDLDAVLKRAITSNTGKSRPVARVSIIDSVLSAQEIDKLYYQSSVLLFPSRGEGFGLPVAEAMQRSCPVIYTNWSALPEVAFAPGNNPVEYHLDEAYGMLLYGYERGLQYAIPSISSCMYNLRNMYTTWKNGQEEYFATVSENERVVNRRYGIEACTVNYMNFINDSGSMVSPLLNWNGSMSTAPEVS